MTDIQKELEDLKKQIVELKITEGNIEYRLETTKLFVYSILTAAIAIISGSLMLWDHNLSINFVESISILLPMIYAIIIVELLFKYM